MLERARLLTILLVAVSCAHAPVPGAATAEGSPPPAETEGAPPPTAAAEPTPGAAPAPAPASAAAPGRGARGATEAEIFFCIGETNRYRASKGKPPFQRSTVLDGYAAEGARADHAARQPHQHFNSVQFPASFSGLAENELPWWHLEPGGSVREVIRAGVATMWAEGPGGGHYDNLVGPFTEVGCGLWIDSDAITVVQDFRTP